MSRPTDNQHFAGHGQAVGITTATAFAARRANWAKFKADAANTGVVAIGLAGVTLPAGGNSTTAGWPLSAGQETDWLPVKGALLSNFYRICTGVGDHCSYMLLD